MRPLTIKEFVQFIFFKSSIERYYLRNMTRQSVIKHINDTLSVSDDLYITKPNPKRFTGSFIPNSDNFIANLTYSIRRFSYTIPRMIEINGSIKVDNDKSQIDIEFKQTSEVRRQIIMLGIFNAILLLVLAFKIRDLISALSLIFIMIITTGLIIASSYNKISRQIKYTEDFLIYGDVKTAGNNGYSK